MRPFWASAVSVWLSRSRFGNRLVNRHSLAGNHFELILSLIMDDRLPGKVDDLLDVNRTIFQPDFELADLKSTSVLVGRTGFQHIFQHKHRQSQSNLLGFDLGGAFLNFRLPRLELRHG